MKKLSLLFAVLCVILLMSGCGGETSKDEVSAAESSEDYVDTTPKEPAPVQDATSFYDTQNDITITFPLAFSSSPNTDNGQYIVFYGENQRNYVTYTVKSNTGNISAAGYANDIRGQYPGAEVEEFSEFITKALVPPQNEDGRYTYIFCYIGNGKIYKLEMSCVGVSIEEFRRLASALQIRSGR